MPLTTKGIMVPEQPPTAAKTEDLVLTPAEAAPIAKVSTRTITRLCESGAIRACKLGKSWRINRAAFVAQFGA